MEPRISIITLGVSDLGRSTRFYRDGLGFPEHEAGGDEITFVESNPTGQLPGMNWRPDNRNAVGQSKSLGLGGLISASIAVHRVRDTGSKSTGTPTPTGAASASSKLRLISVPQTSTPAVCPLRLAPARNRLGRNAVLP